MNIKTTSSIRRVAAFTLVELAIVLVVVAILLGGLMVGKDMIHAANLREVPTQAYEYIAKIQKFRDKYNALPGDMPNAVQIWGSAADGSYINGCTDNEFQTATRNNPATATCNGNGNSTIGYHNVHRVNAAGSSADNILARELAESLRMWQHLHNAGMMKQKLTGARSAPYLTDFHSATIGENVPQGPVSPGGYHMRFIDAANEENGDDEYFDNLTHRHVLHYGADIPYQEPFLRVLLPKEAFQIDQKLDDGIPNKGKIAVMRNRVHGDCTAVSGSATIYQKNVENTAWNGTARSGCVPLFITGY